MTGARRKVLAPVGLSEWLAMQLTGRPPAHYRLHAVIVHTDHSLDAGRYFSFCRAVRPEEAEAAAAWTITASACSTTARRCRPQRFIEASHTLLYWLAESAESRQGRSVGALPLVQNGRSPPGARCSGDSGHPGPGFA